MKGGTYARAMEAGFNEQQATFFSHFSIDLKNETIERMNQEIEEFKKKNRLRSVFARLLRSIADNLEKK